MSLEVVGRGLGDFLPEPIRELFSDLVAKFGVDREPLTFLLGDLALFAESINQCFQCAS